MNAELLKLRLLALPRWTAIAVLGGVVVTGAMLDVFPRDDGAAFIGVMGTVTSLLTEIAAIVLGAWAATLEFNSGALQRTLTAQADRSRVLLAKLGVLVLAVAALAIAAAAAAGGLVDVVTRQQGIDLDRGELARTLFANVPAAITVTVVAFGLGLLTRSIGGAITVALTFVLVLPGLLVFLPAVNRLVYATFEGDMTSRLAGDVAPGVEVHSLPVAVLGVVVWAVVLLVPGWLRFLRDDLK
ncbi:ABC transporter permease [Blastococcus sp. URHD0036]|uniref:ABC transporter permease n=1 Tax=Blastococcus sp. URHD0036 TaxID=1380356 RepID=UPI0004952A31|nr:ABC transporter permease [Blastococcus sp. URHD0036]